MTSDIHDRMDERLRAIKKAGEVNVGVKLGYQMRKTPSRAQVEAEYKRRSRWLDRHRKKFPGW